MHKSHHTYHPCGNKFLQKRWDESKYADHRLRVRVAKPMVDTKAPKVQPHVVKKLKKQQLERERNAVIDRDNYTLLRNMQKTMEGGGIVDHKNTYAHHSLNRVQRQRELERISGENQAILTRLQTVKPHYRVHDWLSDWQRHQSKVEMITAFPDLMHTYPGHGGGHRASTAPSGRKLKNRLTDSRKSLPTTSVDNTTSSLSSSDTKEVESPPQEDTEVGVSGRGPSTTTDNEEETSQERTIEE